MLIKLLPPGTELTVVRSFDVIESRWRHAQTHCPGYGFQSFDWLHTWQQTIGTAQGWSPYLVELTDTQHRTLMLLPLGVRIRHGVRTLSFLGGEVTDYNLGLFDPAFIDSLDDRSFEQLWQQVLGALPAVDLIRLRRMPHQIGTINNPFARLPRASHTENAHAATLPETFAQFKQSRSPRLFADTRRKARRLAELGEVRISIDESGPGRAAAVAAMARQKSRRWRQTGGRDLFAEPGYLAFYETLAANGLGGGTIMMSALYVDDHIVASHWGMCYQQRFYWLMPGYEDGEWERRSVGRILLDALVQWAVAEKLTVFDLTVGDDAYKQQWADHLLPLYALNAARTPAGALILRCQSIGTALRAWAKQQAWLRSSVQKIRARLRRS
jgi:CelD/BcsL family acetyltransferase involved in cellulose biosynthesis